MKLLRLAFCALLALAGAALAWRVQNGVETGLYALLDPGRRSVMSALADNLNGQIRVLVEGPSWEAVKGPADDFRALLHKLGKAGDAKEPKAGASLRDTIAYLAPRTGGLLTDETRARLLAGRYGEVATNAASLLFSGFTPPLFSVKKDPFLLATDYVTHLERRDDRGWTLRDGDPAIERDGKCCLMLVGETGGDLSAGERVKEIFERARAFDAKGGPVRVFCSGAPFHACLAVESSKREINVLSGISLAIVLALGWLLFRSVRFVPPVLFALGSGFLVATAALFLGFARPHLISFVFGTSLIGLGVDYTYHVLAAGGARRILRSLTFSLLTTLACFAPLFFSAVDVLRQMALFTTTGLVTIFAAVTLFFRSTDPDSILTQRRRDAENGVLGEEGARRSKMPCTSPCLCASVLKKAGWVYGLLALVLVCGVFRLRFGNDISRFYKADPYLAAGEARLYDLGRAASTHYLIVAGDSVQDALEREEAAGVKGLSAIIPSLKRQRENAALVAALHQKVGRAYTALTGLPVSVPVQNDDSFLDPEQVTDPLLLRLIRPMLVRSGEKVLLVSPEPNGKETPTRPGVETFDVKQALIDLFDEYAAETYRLLGVSFCVLVVLLVALFRRNFFRYLLPTAAAIAVSLGVLGWCGVQLNFFHALCFFVFVGLGLDYTIFHLGQHDDRTRRAVLFSFLTSFTGLGMLAFTSFSVTASMGITLALGLFFAYVFSFIWARLQDPGHSASAEDAGWYAQREQSAGAVRLQILWLVYRFLGKNVLKLVVTVVMLFIYPFAKPARRSLRKFYSVLAESSTKTAPFNSFPLPSSPLPPHPSPFTLHLSPFTLFRHLLGFAWSLVDKMDACTLRRALPRMTVRDDAGARAFFQLVAEKKGAFLISTHVGTIEVLPALASASPQTLFNSSTLQLFNFSTFQPPFVHAFQQMGHDAVFTKLFVKHLDTTNFALHAVEDIGVVTAVQMQEAIGRGELVLMAGDRVSAGSPNATLPHDFLGRPCVWPKGVFVFARLMEAPIFFVTCVRTGWNAYEVHFDAPMMNPRPKEILDAYARFLEAETRAHPDQWYHFHDFFHE